jgi:AmmeMemoRadiSam system protein B
MLSERPQLRPHLQRTKYLGDPHHVYLEDRLGLAEPVRLSTLEFTCLEFFDGSHTLKDVQHRAMQRLGGELVRYDQLAQLAARLEEALLLDSPRFHDVANNPVRPPRCLGCYEAEPDALRRQLRALFAHPQGAGLPQHVAPDASLRAALIPHIDYERGGLSYTHAFKEVFEKTDASLFVIIGTSHYSSARFSLTRKHFQTPLGIAPTDQEYIDRLVRHYGDGLFDDEWLAHFPEHSIELEVVFLQYLYEGVRPIRIVPLVVGSFHDCVCTGVLPGTRSDIARMIESLQRTEAETQEPICYLISGDLAHIGPKFVPGQRLDERLLRHSYQQDFALLRQAETVNLHGYFQVIAEEEDARNICGLPPTFATLATLQPRCGKLLHYDRYVHPQGHESVSFASMAFYK